MKTKIQNKHRQAMGWADQAFVAQINGDKDEANGLWRKAFELEREVALTLAKDLSAEPTRSVLLRSAASLALECSEMREAERLITMALSGNPPQEIAEELRELYAQVNLLRQPQKQKRKPPVAAKTVTRLKTSRKKIVIQGELRHADAPKFAEGRIWLVESDGTRREIVVPKELMAGIVKPLWEDTVKVTGLLTGEKIVLETIQRIDL